MIETERLILRLPTSDDFEDFARVFAIDAVWRYSMTGRGLTAEETRAWLERQLARWRDDGLGQFAVILKQTGAIAGYCGLGSPTFLPEIMPCVEIGYRIAPEHWNQGLMTEAARAVLRWAFGERGLDRLVAVYEPANVGSGRVMQKIGMREWRDAVIPDSATTVRIYEITRAEWLAQSSSV